MLEAVPPWISPTVMVVQLGSKSDDVGAEASSSRAMKHAVIAGREAYLAGRMPKKRYADPSSPLGGLI